GIVQNQLPPAVRADPSAWSGHPQRTPENRRAGFDDWYGFEVINGPFQSYIFKEHDLNPTRLKKYQTDALTDIAIDYLQRYERDEPLFMVLSVEPHISRWKFRTNIFAGISRG